MGGKVFRLDVPIGTECILAKIEFSEPVTDFEHSDVIVSGNDKDCGIATITLSEGIALEEVKEIRIEPKTNN